MINPQDYSKEIDQIQKLLDLGEVYQALNAAKQLLFQEPNNPKLQSYCAGIFIDCGNPLKDIESVRLGITLIENLLEKNEIQSSSQVILKYNLSNGYAELASILGAEDNEAMSTAFQKQKQLLQTIILDKDNLPDELLPNVITNYANLLDRLGRTVEAIDLYYECLEVTPNHAIAMGNCGSALQRLLNISLAHNPKVLYEAWRLMKEANQRKSDLVRISGKHVILQYQSALTNFEKYIESIVPGGFDALEKQIVELEKDHRWQPSSMLSQLKNDRLLLTVNPRPSNCPSEYKDDIFFEEMVVALDDSGERLFQALAHSFNHAKEDFATARYLYYQSKSQESSLIEVSTITSYMDTLDYADFGLRSGFLKSSLRIAADLLDKCAGFINLYLELGHSEDQVILNNVWYVNRNRKNGLHPEVESRLASNQYLAALYDLNKDLFTGKYPAPFRNLRNDATHKRLVLSWYGDLDESSSSHSLKEFQTTVRFLLRMAKAAIIYLVGIVKIEEQQRELKRQNSKDKNLTATGLPFRIGFGLSDEVDRHE